ncbi:MAG: NAD(P)H-dependent oxidoreductase subunit E [Chloroflexi bacterium]|nr:NAD(P)H-dependent oxidoreductase subunit E [Chloroflexota bacterium]
MLTSASCKITMSGDRVTSNPNGQRERIGEALANQKARTVTVLSSLLAIEDAIGYIPPEAITEVAAFTRSTINDVWGVASFYTNFRFTPPGQHVVEVCWGPTCHLLGAQGVLQAVVRALGLSEEGDTPDGQVSLKYNTCLGACSQGPLLSIDHRVIGPQSLGGLKGEAMTQRIAEMVSQLRDGTPQNSAHGKNG